MKSVAFYTLGCKLNFSESSAIARQFESAGYTVVPFEDGADINVINTCSVTDHADRKTKRVVRQALQQNPNAQVVVVGCYAQLKPQEIIEIPGVNLVLGAREKFNILSYLDGLQTGCEPGIFNTHIKEARDFHPSYSIGDRTRTFLKVQDGCNYFCSFCTIPLARGRSRSGTIAETVAQAEKVAASGVKEIVLTGVNIGDFKSEQGEDFFQLIQSLDKVEGISRFRISSIEPNLLSEDIIRFVAASERFIPHFHIPLQSGSDDLLKSMRRRYDTQLYRERIEMIKTLMPYCCIGVDVIVGLPGETEAHFHETLDFLHSLPVSYLHVFTYSERPNTTAVRLPGRVPQGVRKERNAILTNLSEKKRRAFYEEHLSATRPVLWEAEQKEGFQYGFTDNYIKVVQPYDASCINTIASQRLAAINADGLVTVA